MSQHVSHVYEPSTQIGAHVICNGQRESEGQTNSGPRVKILKLECVYQLDMCKKIKLDDSQ